MFPNMHNVMFGQLYSYRDYFGHQLSNDCLIGDILVHFPATPWSEESNTPFQQLLDWADEKASHYRLYSSYALDI